MVQPVIPYNMDQRQREVNLAPNEGQKMGLRLSKVGGVAGRSESGGARKSEKARRKDKGEKKKSKDYHVSQSSQNFDPIELIIKGPSDSQRGIVKSVLTLHDPGQPSGGLGRSVVEALESLGSLGHPGIDAGDVFEGVGDELSHIVW